MDPSSYRTAQCEDDNPDDSDDDVECCMDSEDCNAELFFCKACDLTFCSKCWKTQVAHIPKKKKKKGPAETSESGAIPHEKISLSTKKLLKPVFSNRVSNETIKTRLAEDADAAWFGVSREGDDNAPIYFHDYGRYAELMASLASSPSTPSHISITESIFSSVVPRRTPSLVSFVGEAGAGKSTLIKLLILMKALPDQPRPQCPVGGSSGGEDPTSEDVHLYLDPLSGLSNTPLLYADCEGLNGGEREPLAAISRREASNLKLEEQSIDEEDSLFPTRYSSQREIQWAKSRTERTRNFAVSRFYPRLLFTFSDVVIFVHRNPKVIEGVLQQLIEWAAAALETACNQPVLPHAIILLNASPNEIDPEWWDVELATRRVLESLAATVNQNAAFSRHAKLWKDRGRVIKSVEDLMMCYYSSVRVVRLPTDMQSNLILEQAQKLYTEIELGCQKARKRKSDLRMLLDAEELQSYLQDAFDLYSQSLDIPFDFVQASFLHNPIPFNFGGNILKLAIAMTKEYRMPDAHAIFRDLGNLVASCIMLDAVRNNILGTAELLFPRYLDYLEEAFKTFCDQHWPCEYIMHGIAPEDLQYGLGNTNGWNEFKTVTVSYRCVNVRVGHEKGHQNKEGRIFAKGSYFTRFSFRADYENFELGVYLRLEYLLSQLAMCIANGELQEAAAARMHRDNLQKFFYRPIRKDTAIDLQNRTVCWCCLFEGPVHALRCGHVLCTPCVKAYGHSEGRTVVRMHECPFEVNGLSQPQSIYIKPPTAGLRMLVLDDGGIRGLVQLEILRLIEKEINVSIPLRLFFDLIVGSGSGSIIALGLLTNSWTIENCRARFLRIFKESFASRNLRRFPRLKHSTCKYRPKALEQALRETFTEDHVLLGVGNDEMIGALTKLAIPVKASPHKAMIFANYVRRSDVQLPYQIHSPVDTKEEIKIWEAARAAMAHPFLFKPFKHKVSNQAFINDPYLANPIMTASAEAKALWDVSPLLAPLDIVVSLGTGASIGPSSLPDHLENTSKSSRIARRFTVGKKKKIASFDQHCEKNWKDYVRTLPNNSSTEDKYTRLNIKLTELPAIDDVDIVDDLRKQVYTQMSRRTIETLTSQLIARMFYFEKQGEMEMTSRREMFLRGEILCRLPNKTPGIAGIGKLLRAGKFQSNQFIIQEQLCEPQHVNISSEIIQNMIHNGEFHMPEVKINISERCAEFNIYLHLENNENYAISGTPRFLVGKDNQSKRETRDGRESPTSIRPRRPQWKPPKSRIDPGPEVVSNRPSSTRVPSSSTIPSVGDIHSSQPIELIAPDYRDQEEIYIAMRDAREVQVRNRIRNEEVGSLEERIGYLETLLLERVRNPSVSDFPMPPQWQSGMVSPDLDDAPFMEFNSRNPSRATTVRRENENKRHGEGSNIRDLLGP